MTSKAASGYFVESVWFWIKENVPKLKKICPETNKKRLHVNYLLVQVIFRQLLAETAGNRYLRRFLPTSAHIQLWNWIPAIAGNFARASFTVYFLRKFGANVLKNSWEKKIQITYRKYNEKSAEAEKSKAKFSQKQMKTLWNMIFPFWIPIILVAIFEFLGETDTNFLVLFHYVNWNGQASKTRKSMRKTCCKYTTMNFDTTSIVVKLIRSKRVSRSGGKGVENFPCFNMTYRPWNPPWVVHQCI